MSKRRVRIARIYRACMSQPNNSTWLDLYQSEAAKGFWYGHNESGRGAWDAPTFRVCSDLIADFTTDQKATAFYAGSN